MIGGVLRDKRYAKLDKKEGRCLVPCPSCKHPCWSHFSCGCCGECKACEAVHLDVADAAAHPVH